MYAYLALAGLQLVGGYQQADIIRQNATLQSNIADMNAKYAQVDAYNAIESGYGNANKYAGQVDTAISSEREAYASADVDIKYGTAKDVESDNRIAGLENVLQIQKQAQNAAAGYEAQAINIHLGGQMAELQGNLNASSAQSSGVMSAITTGIAGYAYGQSTGKGTSSRTGTDAKPGANRTSPNNLHLTPAGDGVRAPSSVGPDGFGWYPDEGKSGPGFFGKGPRESYSHGSFTDELGG